MIGKEPLVATGPGASVAGAAGAGDAAAAREGPGRIGLAFAIVLWTTVVVRALTEAADPGLRPWYVVGLTAFLVIALIVLLHRGLSAAPLHVAFGLQAALVLVLLSLDPEVDFVTALFVVQCYQAAVVFHGRTRLVWVIALVALIGVSLVGQLGPVRGLAFALSYMAAGIVIPTYVVASRELETSREKSQRMVGDLQAAQRQLEVYAGQVEELAAIEQRSRLAHELDESVSLTLSGVVSATRAAESLLDESDAAAAELERLQAMTQQALAQMRQVIAELRPRPAEAAADG
jgi:signal transduction histidine kinase